MGGGIFERVESHIEASLFEAEIAQVGDDTGGEFWGRGSTFFSESFSGEEEGFFASEDFAIEAF